MRNRLLVMALVIIVVIVVTALIVNFPGGVGEDANEGYGVDPTETTPLGP